MIYLIYVLACILLISCGQLLLKMGARTRTGIRLYLNLQVISGYILILLATIFTVLALGGIELKVVYTLMSLNYILIMVLSCVFLKEKLTAGKIAGTALIMIGVVIFNL